MNSIFCLTVYVLLTQGKLLAGSPKLRSPIYFLLSDDLTYHDIGCYGNEEVRTPTIDQMAEDGTF